MAQSVEMIRQIVRNAVMQVTGIKQLDDDKSLVGVEYGINPVDFLYIFEMIGETLERDVSYILAEASFEIMTVNHLSDAIDKYISMNC